MMRLQRQVSIGFFASSSSPPFQATPVTQGRANGEETPFSVGPPVPGREAAPVPVYDEVNPSVVAMAPEGSPEEVRASSSLSFRDGIQAIDGKRRGKRRGDSVESRIDATLFAFRN